jgi:hypothetical protein
MPRATKVTVYNWRVELHVVDCILLAVVQMYTDALC